MFSPSDWPLTGLKAVCPTSRLLRRLVNKVPNIRRFLETDPKTQPRPV